MVVHAVFIASIKWDNFDVWLKAIHFCRDKGCVRLIQARWIILAMTQFGGSKVREV